MSVEARKTHTLFGEGVHIRRQTFFAAIEAGLSPTHVVRHDKNDVGLATGMVFFSQGSNTKKAKGGDQEYPENHALDSAEHRNKCKSHHLASTEPMIQTCPYGHGSCGGSGLEFRCFS